MAGKYWLNETPREIKTERNILKWYQKEGRFQVGMLFKDTAGELKQGKTGVLDAEDLALNPAALDLLQEYLDDCRKLMTK